MVSNNFLKNSDRQLTFLIQDEGKPKKFNLHKKSLVYS